jgi:hypothetical protein
MSCPENWFAPSVANRSRLFLRNEKPSLDFPATSRAAPVPLPGESFERYRLDGVN